MTELSTAAKAVLTAVTLKRYNVTPKKLPAFAEEMAPLIAAALRATADHLCLHWHNEITHPADVLNNIANELEGA